MNAWSSSAIPGTVAWLGYGGLIPFVGLAAAAFIDPETALFWDGAMVAYGAAILSFIGALHWGFAITIGELTDRQRNASLLWSVVPCLLAWVALLIPPLAASALLVAAFLLHYWQDWRFTRVARLPEWYLPLRLRLTVVACFSVGAGAFALRR
jgi:hypothetical protein